MSEPTADDWLLSLDHNRTRRLARQEQPPDEKSPGIVADADQGALGLPPSTRPKRSPDSWLMEITDLGKGEHTGDSDDYERLYSD